MLKIQTTAKLLPVPLRLVIGDSNHQTRGVADSIIYFNFIRNDNVAISRQGREASANATGTESRAGVN
jgi:hypothetical protein